MNYNPPLNMFKTAVLKFAAEKLHQFQRQSERGVSEMRLYKHLGMHRDSSITGMSFWIMDDKKDLAVDCNIFFKFDSNLSDSTGKFPNYWLDPNCRFRSKQA